MSTRHPVVVALAIAAVIVVAVLVVDALNGRTSATCAELTTEMLTMTGPNATVDYDLERVQEINAARADQGCTP